MKYDNLRDADPKQQDNIDFVWKSLPRKVYNLQYASERLRSDKEFVRSVIVNFGGHALQYASKELQNDLEMIKESLSNGGYLGCINSKYRENKEVIYYLLSFHESRLDFGNMKTVIKQIPYEAFMDKRIFSKIIENFPNFLQLIAFDIKQVRKDKEFVKDAININGLSLQYMSNEYKDNIKIVYEAVKNCPDAIKYSSRRIKKLIGLDYQDPLKFFERYFLTKNLQEDLKDKKNTELHKYKI